MLTFKLKEQPEGFDVVQLDSGGQEHPYRVGDQVLPGIYIRSKRQPDFQESAFLKYAVTDPETKTETEDVQEVGLADLRDDCLILLEKLSPNDPGYRIQTNSECFPKT